eukprot:scaffold19909_cov130-Isochrysis_galbana.AAC.7
MPWADAGASLGCAASFSSSRLHKDIIRSWTPLTAHTTHRYPRNPKPYTPAHPSTSPAKYKKLACAPLGAAS